MNLDHQLPMRWVPLDVDGPTPGTRADWAGMSGAGVLLADRRVAGVVVAAEATHQLRRLYVVPIADILERSPIIADALSSAIGFRAIAEARAAPLYRNVLREPCIGPDGLPVCVREASLGAFGVRPAGIAGESEFLDYVPRDKDRELRDSMLAAQADRRMLLVVGGSAGGKSRSAAEAARMLFGGYRLMCPRSTALARLLELPITDISPALVWLDDAERYDERAFRDTVESLRQSGVMVVATIRRGELEARKPRGDRRSALAEALEDRQLVAEMPWPTKWSVAERSSITQHVHDKSLVAAVSEGASPSEWVVAGPELKHRLDDARADDERPARYALMRAVLDWYRTPTAKTISTATAVRLLQDYLPKRVKEDDISDALSWAFEDVLGAARTTSQSLITKTLDGDGLLPHDYIQDLDATGDREPIPDHVLKEALLQAPADDTRLSIGETAHDQGSNKIASSVFIPPPATPEDILLPLRKLAEEGSRSDLQSPYRGLMPFSEADAEVFYGREQLTAKLAATLATRLEHGGLVIVTGPSASGKTSLLRAGLLPVLARGTVIPGAEHWPRTVMTPSPHPLSELAVRIAVLGGANAAAVRSELTSNPDQAHLIFQQAIAAHSDERADDDDKLVLIVDQFEELFTLSMEEAERRAFVAALSAAASCPAGWSDRPPALVILSVRADYIDRLTDYPELAVALSDGMFIVGPMTDSDLYRAVTGPADAAGLIIDADLAEIIQADLRAAFSSGATVGLLPLLSQAMLLTWESREGNHLTAHGYKLAGGVSIAVQISAENAYNALTTEQKHLAHGLLLAMTTLSNDGRFTPRRLARTELYAGHKSSDMPQIDAVLEAFADRRLIVLDRDAVELAHEALITDWPRLREWLDADRASLRIYNQLAEDAHNWADSNADPSFLYRGTRLAALLEANKRWTADPARFPAPSSVQREFIRASSAAAARSARQRRIIGAIIVLLLITSLVSAFLAFTARR